MPEKPNSTPAQQVTLRLPLDMVAPWTQLDSAQHTLHGIANILDFIKQPELAGFVRAHAVGIANKRDEIMQRAQSRVQLAGPNDVPKG